MGGVFTHRLGCFNPASGGIGAFSAQTFETGTTETTALAVSDSGFFGGTTPAAALVFGNYHEPANDPSETAHGMVSVGFATSTANELYAVTRSQDNVASTVVDRVLGSTNILAILSRSTATYLKRFSVSSFAANTLNIGRDTNTDANMRAMVALFESATQATTGTVNLGTGTSAITVSPGFQADVVILVGNNGPTGSFGSFLGHSFGFATSADQRCVIMAEADAAAAGAPRMAILTTAAAGQVSTADGSLSYSCSVGNFTSTSFDVTPSANAGSDDLIWLALKFSGRSVDIIDITTPTSTGSTSHTGASITPTSAIGVLTNLEATDPSFPISTADTMSGLAYFIASGSNCHTAAMRVDSGADPTDTASNLQSGLLQPSATNTAAGVASFTGFVSGGFQVNWSAVQGTAKKGFALVVS